MATLNGNLGGLKDKKMNYGAGKLISAEHLLLIHGDDPASLCFHFFSLSCPYWLWYCMGNFDVTREHVFFEPYLLCHPYEQTLVLGYLYIRILLLMPDLCSDAV